MEFEFDNRKAASNLRKHGVSFVEACSSLIDGRAIWIENPDAQGEQRWIVWGLSDRGRLLAVVVTTRGDRLRIISARKATRPENRTYAKRIRFV